MDEKYAFYCLAVAFFLIFFIKSGKYLDSIGLGVACAFIVAFIVTQFNPVQIINRNDFSGAKVELKIKEEVNHD